MEKKQATLENQLYIIGLCLLPAAALALAAYRWLGSRLLLFGLPCVLHALTGYYCPGCGGTRAVYALLHMQPLKAFCFHPLVPYGAAVYLWFMLSHTVERLTRRRVCIGMRWRSGWLWAALAILAVNTLIRDGALFFFGVDLLAAVS